MSRHLLTTLILILVLPFAHSCSDDSDDYIIKPDRSRHFCGKLIGPTRTVLGPICYHVKRKSNDI